MPNKFGIVGIPRRGRGPYEKPAPGSIINPQHPLAQGMAGYWSFIDTLDSVSRLPLTNSGATITYLGALFAAGTQKMTAHNELIGTGIITFTASVLQTSATGYQRIASNGKFICLLFEQKCQLFRDNATVLSTPALAVPTGKLTRLSTVSPASGTSTIYVNGAYSVAGSAGNAATGDNALVFGNRAASDRGLNGTIEMACLHKRALNPTEIAQLHWSPYSMFWQPGRRAIFVPMGGEPEDISGSLEITEADDSVDLIGTAAIVGSLETTDADDTIDADASVFKAGQQGFFESGTWNWPDGVTVVVAECQGGGGAGGGAEGAYAAGGGGKGGGYAKTEITKGEESSLSVVVGEGGTYGDYRDGGITSVTQGETVVARASGGAGAVTSFYNINPDGPGATAPIGTAVGDVTYEGGSGADGYYTEYGGGGGGAAGSTGAGGAASGSTGGAGTAENAGDGSGDGANGVTSENTAGVAGSAFGGGGSGARSDSSAVQLYGGVGGDGFVIFKWLGLDFDAELEITDADDTLDLDGTLAISASLSITDSSDTIDLIGLLAASSSLEVTDASDTTDLTGTLAIVGSLEIEEENDSVDLDGVISAEDISGSLETTDADDTLDLTGTLAISGGLEIEEEDDDTDGEFSVGDFLFGSLDIVEEDDSLDLLGTLDLSVSLEITDASDSIELLGTLALSAELEIAEQDDSIDGDFLIGEYPVIQGELEVEEEDDTTDIIGSIVFVYAPATGVKKILNPFVKRKVEPVSYSRKNISQANYTEKTRPFSKITVYPES